MQWVSVVWAILIRETYLENVWREQYFTNKKYLGVYFDRWNNFILIKREPENFIQIKPLK